MEQYFVGIDNLKAIDLTSTVELNDAVKEIAAAKGYSLKVEGDNLVYGPKAGFLVIVR